METIACGINQCLENIKFAIFMLSIKIEGLILIILLNLMHDVIV